MADKPRRWLNENEQNLWRAWVGARFRLIKALNEDLERSGDFDHLTYEIFVNLSESKDHSLRMTELAKRVNASKSLLTYRITTLEKKGLVKRINCDDDRRGYICQLTKEGFDTLVRIAPSHVETVLDNFIEKIDPADIDDLTKILNGIAQDNYTRNQ